MKIPTALALLLAACAASALADDRAQYNARAAASDEAAFRELDLNRDGQLTKDEVQADLSFGPRFDETGTASSPPRRCAAIWSSATARPGRPVMLI